MSDINYNQILDGLLWQLEKYNQVFRKSTQPFKKAEIINHFPEYKFNFDDKIIRETLLEHVGCLPIVATYLHQYIDKPIDLGKVLIMLSIHDIGELVVGDETFFNKQKQVNDNEFEAALNLLPEYQKEYFIELEKNQTNEAKFANSVDKLVPSLLELFLGKEATIDRVSAQTGWEKSEVLEKIKISKQPFVLWSDFMYNFTNLVFERMEQS
jgi:putative hydrolases of HD superfamily